MADQTAPKQSAPQRKPPRLGGQLYPLPHVGLRTLKTALAATLCALAYYFIDRSPAFACIGAIFGLGFDEFDSRLNGGNRLFGTIIGGLIGMGLFRFYLLFYPQGGRHFLLVPLTFVGTVLLILLCQMFWVGGVQPGGVVLCILLFNTPVETYVSYALNRILDTAVGVMAALLVNRLLPRERLQGWLRGFSRREEELEACPAAAEEEE